MNLPGTLGLGYGLSELVISVAKRDRSGGSRGADRGSLALIWVVVCMAIAGGVFIAHRVTFGRFEITGPVLASALVLYAGGLALRGWAIAALGRFFTVNVAIHREHRLITAGPYAFVRHPSYTGALLVVLGIAVLYGSLPGLLVTFAPILAVMLFRIAVEERALREALGEEYVRYAERVRALIPGVW